MKRNLIRYIRDFRARSKLKKNAVPSPRSNARKNGRNDTGTGANNNKGAGGAGLWGYLLKRKNSIDKLPANPLNSTNASLHGKG